MSKRFSRAEFDAALAARAIQDRSFKERLLADPTRVYSEELGRAIPEEATIRVIEETKDTFYVVLPYVPQEVELTREIALKVGGRELTHRDPCWGLGDGIERYQAEQVSPK
jgi:hypothetical protein